VKTETPDVCVTVSWKVCRIAVALCYVYSQLVRMYKVLINPIIQSKTRLISHATTLNRESIVTCRPIARERVTNTFPWKWILGNQLTTEHVSVNTGVQQEFPWILIRYITGNSEHYSWKSVVVQIGIERDQN
jgi:hypothetical protein